MKRHLQIVGVSIAVLMLLTTNRLISQGWDYEEFKPDKNLYNIQKSFNTYWVDKNINEKGKGWKIFKRWEWFWQQRVYPDGKFPNPSQTYLEYQKRLQYEKDGNDNTLTVGSWQSVGPTSDTGGYVALGRINIVREHPANSNILFAGAASGGLWKSTDGGQNWTTNTDGLASLGISDIVFAPNNSNVMYLATGDGDYTDTYSIGVLKSTNGGSTWNTTGLSWTTNINRSIYRLLIDPNNANVLYAATNNGIYKTTNAGNNWSLIFSEMAPRDMKLKPGTPSTIYAARNALYRSTDNGTTWTQLTNGLPASGITRIELAVTPDSSDYIYAVIAGNGFLGLYRSIDGGDSWTEMSDSPNILGWSATGSDQGSQAWYDLCIAIAPNNVDEIYVGGINIWKSTNGGTNWTRASYWNNSYPPVVHADQHSLWFAPNSNRLYVGNDGGIYKTTSGGTNWTWLGSGLAITQFYRLGTSATNANIMIAGSQDNGTKLRDSNGDWADAFGGDGMECVISYSNPDTMYAESKYGFLKKSINGGASWFNMSSLPSEYYSGYGSWITPFVMDPDDVNTLYIGYRNIFKTTNGGNSWTAISAFTSGSIQVLQVAPSNHDYIYASKGTSYLKVTTDGGTNWSQYQLPGSTMLTYIAVDDDAPENIWLTFSGYYANDKVYHSTDAGQTWTNISNSLPNVPVNCIVHQKNYYDRIYVGTDIGVYYRDDNSNGWVSFNSNLPNVIINELEIQYNSQKIRAATYGRGIWESDISTTIVSTPVLNSPADSATGVLINNTLVWNTANNATSYVAQYSTNSDFSSSTETTTSDTSWSISNLDFDTRYYWRVKASDGNVNTPWSAVGTFTTEELVLSSPALSSPVNNTSDADIPITLEWNSVTYAQNYIVQYSTDTNFTNNTEVSVTSTSTELSGLNVATTYYWRVKASADDVVSSWSDVRNFTTYATTLSAPDLTSPADNATGISNNPTLSWDTVSGAVSYYIQYSTVSDFSTNTETTSTSTSLSLSNLSFNTTYYWRVKVYNGSIYSNWSDVREFTTEVLVLSSPSLSSPSNNADDISINVTLNWQSVANASGYVLQYSTVSDFSSNTEITTSNTSYSLSSLTFNTRYYWRVKATHNTTSSQWSSAWNFVTQTLTLDRPRLIYPRNRRRNYPITVTFRFSAVDNATGYVLKYDRRSNFRNATEVTNSTNSCTVTFDYNTWYYWRVKATNGNVSGRFSRTRKFKTKSAKYAMPGDDLLISDEAFTVSPNPAVSLVNFGFYVDEETRIELDIYDLNSRKILNVFAGYMSEGEHTKTISTSELNNGIYVAVLKIGDRIIPKRIIILK